ncbi:hypothetical protein OEZ71_16500 [Defluviimonas sp. WL0050]|uniref:Uncharacterized protein n=1 Tax=Albidovulum litorale TaxID=2984134 RepID=A0ABT2ZSA8_9RHOB|nr:hypothetical protein [Defluviimonas sp. WL0050]MCV2873899.1 hypothetical protein [Defluviimonas sp. WL0050]
MPSPPKTRGLPPDEPVPLVLVPDALLPEPEIPELELLLPDPLLPDPEPLLSDPELELPEPLPEFDPFASAVLRVVSEGAQ